MILFPKDRPPKDRDDWIDRLLLYIEELELKYARGYELLESARSISEQRAKQVESLTRLNLRLEIENKRLHDQLAKSTEDSKAAKAAKAEVAAMLSDETMPFGIPANMEDTKP